MLTNRLEEHGIPAVLVTNLQMVAASMHVNRVFAGVAIPHVFGDPNLPPNEEKALRRRLVEQALTLLTRAPEAAA